MTQPQDKPKSIFLNALEIPSFGERQAYLARACGEDAELRREVEAMLKHHGSLGSFLEDATIAVPEPLLERPGTVIGPYRLLEQIGEGGFGVVFMAEQTQPVKRRVALKVIKPGMDTRQVIARFEAERQALALMDHPNIARVLDAGATESGRPFFVMELVRGMPITEYCDQARLAPRERLELFVTVCHAMQHAHQKGIIHRDIKPTNVLVTQHDDRPVVKVIDFGVAKATSGQLTTKTLFTGFAQVIGTPLYMSPEQTALSAIDVDTRSDIYSLGVLLYELLTGTTPFDKARLEQAAFDEVRRIIREEEPEKPSTRISTLGETLASISAVRRMEPRKLSQLVKGDLDWIVMKALEKDRSRRYETANGLAADVLRYLTDEPVTACPPSAAYRLRKFARRNKPALTMWSVVALGVLVAVGSIGWMVRDRGARAEEAAHEQAERRARLTGQVALVVEEVHRLEADQKWPEALAAVQRAQALAGGGEVEPGVEAQVRQVAKDLEFLKELEEIRLERVVVKDGKLGDAGIAATYADAFRDYGVDLEKLPLDEAVSRLKAHAHVALPLAAAIDEYSDVRGAAYGVSDAGRLSLISVARGLDPDPTRDRLRGLLGQPVTPELRAELRGLAESIDVARQYPATLLVLSRALRRAGHEDLSLSLMRQAQRRHPDDFWINSELAWFLYRRMDFPGATRFYSVAVALRPSAGVAHLNLGVALHLGKRLDEAELSYRRAVELDPAYAKIHGNLGDLFRDANRLDDAEASCRRAIELDPKSGGSHANLGSLLLDQQKPVEAEASFRRAIELDPTLAVAHIRLGDLLHAQRKLDEAEASLRRAIELDPADASVHIRLGVVHRAQNQPAEAEASFRRAIELDPTNAVAHDNLGLLFHAQKMRDGAEASYGRALELYEESLKSCEARYGADHANTLARRRDLAASHHHRGFLRVQTERFPEAIADFNRAIELAPGALDYVFHAAALYLYAGDVERYRGACRLLLAAAEESGEDPEMGGIATSTCTLAPDSVPDLSRVARLAQRGVSGTEEHPNYGPLVLAMGLTEYRGGRHEQAVEWLKRFVPRADSPQWEAMARAALAMAHHRLGHTDPARASLVSAFTILAERPRGWLWADDWFYWMHGEHLCREAEGLMGAVSEEELALERRNRWDRELPDLSQHVAQHPGSPSVLWMRGSWLLSRGRFDDAERDYARLVQLNGEPAHWFRRACLLAYLGRKEEYREHCRALLSRFAGATDNTLDGTTMGALLLPDGTGGDVEELARLAERAFELAPESPSSTLLRGLAECRAGRFELAAGWLMKCGAAPSVDSPARAVAARAYLAIAWHGLGRQKEARAALERAALDASEFLPAAGTGDLSQGGIENWLIAQTALREAEATVLGRRLSAPPQATGPAVPPAPPSPSAPSPFVGQPAAVPGVVQAEDFDEGGEGVAYHDTTSKNLGDSYRRESVDIEDCADVGGGFCIVAVLAGEWLEYTVEVSEAGLHDLGLRLCSPGGGRLHMEFGGKDVTGPVEVPRTGWGNWTTITATGVHLDAGRQAMRVVFDSDDPDIHVCNLNWIEAHRPTTPAASPSTTIEKQAKEQLDDQRTDE